jgi:hypothetical protein
VPSGHPTQLGSGLVVAALISVATVFLPGCLIDEGRVDPTKLAALKAEPIASMKLPGGKLELEFEIDSERDSFLGPTMAHLVRVFAYEDREGALRGRASAVKAAQASGWKLNLGRHEPDKPLFGGKALSTGGATLIIGTYKADSAYKVSIRLEDQKCGRGRCYGP